jgi:23S rRNA (adenine2503-C2)-methyltransferase
MNHPRFDIRSLSFDQLAEWFREHGEPSYRAGQLWQALHSQGVGDWDGLIILPKRLRETMTREFAFQLTTIAKAQTAPGGTIKLSLAYADGCNTECVFLPQKDHSTACLSVQTGCRMGCKFCRTAMLGAGRNLEPYEIEVEFHLLTKAAAEKPRNVVFMGMGEPLDCLLNTIMAARLLADPAGADVGFRKMTVSTVGIAPAIRELAQLEPRLKIAFSLASPFQQQREELVPSARKYPLTEIISALRFHAQATHRQPTIEYLLLAGINDSEEHARAILSLLTKLPCKINLISYNTNPELSFHAPESAQMLRFQQWLRKGPNTVIIRKSLGAEISAACGQLAGEG